MNFALIKNGVVINTVSCESEKLANELFSTELIVVNIDGLSAGIGWVYDGALFAPPLIVKSQEEIAAENMMMAHSEYDRGSATINELNDQIDDEDFTGTTEDAVKSELAAWTEYRKQLRAYIKAGDGGQTLPTTPQMLTAGK
ncbi:hypothetical protein [Atlantibacter sp.]|uniref:hypothetical protein n=1 Tax=Atlantibacter sp. TaxID=1903473 RepID=UPI00289A329D|nr:hypothetical protein [Atlantibacter sp.]